MKKFIMNLFGIEATAKNIRGQKSDGAEDQGNNFKHWRKYDKTRVGNYNIN